MTTSTKSFRCTHPEYAHLWEENAAKHGTVALTEPQRYALFENDQFHFVHDYSTHRVKLVTWRSMSIICVDDPRDSTLARHM